MGIAANLLARIAAGSFDDDPVAVEGFTPLALPGTTLGVFKADNAAAEVATGMLGGERVLVLAFRGSDDRQDWINDLRNINTDYAKFAPLIAQVEAYAAAHFMTVVVTGHSLGGALTQIFMAEHPAGGAVGYEAVAFASPGALLSPSNDPRITTYQVIDDPIVFLGTEREDVGKLVGSSPIIARAFAEKLSEATPLTVDDVLASLPFLTADYVNRGNIVVMNPGGKEPLTLANVLTKGDFAEHALANYLPLTAIAPDPANQTEIGQGSAAAAAKVGIAIRDVLRVDASASERNADALRLDKGLGLATFTAELVDKAAQSTTPALIVANFIEGATPTSARLDSLTAFADLQYKYYLGVGAQDARLGPYEALGLGFRSTAQFQTKYAGGTDEAYIASAYKAAFKVAPGASQVTHFVEQDAYFETLYQGAGFSAADAALAARGAVVGQILGFAALAANSALNAAATAFLVDASDGDVAYGTALLGASSSSAMEWGV